MADSIPYMVPAQFQESIFPPITRTVKRVDEVVRHPHLVTQDQFTQVSKKVSDIPEENFTINIELFRHFSQMSNLFDRAGKFQKQYYRGANLRPTGLQSATLPLRHTFLSTVFTITLFLAHTYKKMPASCASSVEMLTYTNVYHSYKYTQFVWTVIHYLCLQDAKIDQ